MTRKERLLKFLDSLDDYYDLGEYYECEAIRGPEELDPDTRYVLVTYMPSGNYAWLNFYDSLEECQPDGEWSPVVVCDLDTGDEYHKPKTVWT